MTVTADVEAFIGLLVSRLTETFPNYDVQAYEPNDTQLAPRQIWVTDDDMTVPQEYADLGESVSIVLPVYVTGIFDIPDSAEMQSTLRERRLQVIATVQGTLREYSGPLSATIRGEGLLTRQNYIAASVQIDLELFDLEAM